MELGFVGLGRMGAGMSARLKGAGHRVVGHDASPDAMARAREAGLEAAGDLGALAASLPAPRTVWVMTPPGPATAAVLDALWDILAPGDLVVDGGNSDFRDTVERAAAAARRGIAFVDAGTSGGVEGARNGCGLLLGGDAACILRLSPILDALAAPGAWARVGSVGSGHFAKAVHNAVEYAVMQAYGEGLELLSASPIGVDVGAAFRAYQAGCSIRSHLLGKFVEAIAPDPTLRDVAGHAADSGMGRWTLEEATRLGVPIPAIAAAVQARFRSQQRDSLSMKGVAALRRVVGGHAVKAAEGAAT